MEHKHVDKARRLEMCTDRRELDRSRMPFSDVLVRKEVEFGRREWVLGVGDVDVFGRQLFRWCQTRESSSGASSVLPSAKKL